MLELNKIYCMDCLDGMKQIPNGAIDLVVTDPPYKLASRGATGNMSGYWATDAGKSGRVFEYNDIEIEQYLPEFYRILKDDAHCYIMCNNLNMPHFFDVIGKSKFHFVKLLVWDKQTKICGTYYMGQVEFIFLLRKGKDKHINNCGTSDLLSFSSRRDKNANGTNIHNSQKPIGLMATLIENSTDKDEIVLDPFMGSGTTAIAAKNSTANISALKYHRNMWILPTSALQPRRANCHFSNNKFIVKQTTKQLWIINKEKQQRL